MGLLLSILVVCVGVLEVVACVTHFQSGYLPLWAPHRAAPACTNIHELWRTKPNIDHDCCASPRQQPSSDACKFPDNLVPNHSGHRDISSFEKCALFTDEEKSFSNINCGDNLVGSDSGRTSTLHQICFESGETERKDTCADEIFRTLIDIVTPDVNNVDVRHDSSSEIISNSSNNCHPPGTTETLLPLCGHAEPLFQNDCGSHLHNILNEDFDELNRSRNKHFDTEVIENILTPLSIQSNCKVSNGKAETSVHIQEMGINSFVESNYTLPSCREEHQCVAELLPEPATETVGFQGEFSAQTGDCITEDNVCCRGEPFVSTSKDSFVIAADMYNLVSAATSSPCKTFDDVQQLVRMEQSPPLDLKTESVSNSSQDVEVPCVVRSPASTPGTPRRSKADISWPTFTAVPVIKRPPVALATETYSSFDSFDLSSDIPPEVGEYLDSENGEGTNASEKSDKRSTEDEIVKPKKEIAKRKEEIAEDILGCPIVEPFTDVVKNVVGDNLSDLEVLEESPTSLIPANEFSKKEIMLKRRRSYKSRRQSSSLESVSGSERDDRSISEERIGVAESRRHLRKSSKANHAEDAMNVEKPLPSNSNLTRAFINPESESAKKSVGEWKNSIVVEPEESSHISRNKSMIPENLVSGEQNVAEDISHTSNEELSDSEKKTSPKEAFWLIFSGEYTKAMSKDWHSGHFCCWQCDESLTGQRYVLRDDHPYCIKCYESVFANVCEECNKTIGIDSKDLSYKDKHWHEACFLCNKCRVSLVDKQFGSKADKIYCGNCYDAQFASRCDGCGEIFRAGTKKMEYKTRQWHEKCFCCCVCKSAIGTKSFIPREQEIYCATCYEEKFATRCVKCKKIITSGGVTYKNEPWHRECFTCTNCNTSLAGQRFTSRDEKPYCAECFGELFAKRCTACSKPITGIGGTRFISFEDRHWHNDCFICAACKTSLVGRGFITDADDIICPECAKQKLM